MKLLKVNLTLQICAVGLVLVSLAVVADSVTDPVNVTKLFILGGVACAAIGSCLSKQKITIIFSHKLPVIGALLFLLFSVITLIGSKASFSQSIYGVYGRNNGFILYFFLALIFISTLSSKSTNEFRVINFALFFVGAVNLVYMLWFTFFGDIFPWYNLYKDFLGTFGNPNFIGSFFGIFSSVLFSYAFDANQQIKVRIIHFALLPLTYFGIVQTGALQGKLLFLISLAIVLFFVIRSKYQSKFPLIGYSAILGVFFIIGLLGLLEKGPLSQILYQRTLSLRAQYWYAGWKMGTHNPWLGVGFDSYGDWYRRVRRPSALEFPGIDTVSNAAHNVYLDMFAFGGWPLFLSYLLISLLVLLSIIRHTKRLKQFDPVFCTLTSGWICYQVQSIISINQIGLAIWGWIFGASIIAFEGGARQDLHDRNNERQRKIDAKKVEVITPHVKAGVFSILGLLLAVPPLSADIKWRSAQLSQSPTKLEESLIPNYMNPLNSYKLNFVVGVFETNGFFQLARKYAIISAEKFPDSYESWKNISQIRDSTESEKQEAIEQMKRLDPLNPTIGNIK